MCTAITWKNKDFYFGRNMDIEYSFGEQVAIVPRNYPITFKKIDTIYNHYAMIGMASVVNGYPLFAEAMNEEGLCIAGLNFPGYSIYNEKENAIKDNINPYEIILWILSKCKSVNEAKILIQNMNIIAIPFSENLPLAPLHWIISDKHCSIVLESTKNGLNIIENPVGVMTNNPEFNFHLTNLSNFMNCNIHQPVNSLSQEIDLKPLGQGAGGLGLPGDSSTTSRFIRAVFAKSNSIAPEDEMSSVSQFFHILDNVAMIRGNVITPSGKPDITTYASCMNVDKQIYYYKTYDNNQISAIRMNLENLDSNIVKVFDLVKEQKIHFQN